MESPRSKTTRERHAPKTFGKFHILEELSRSQMGIVYKAEDTSLNRVVALKVLFDDSFTPESESKGSTVPRAPSDNMLPNSFVHIKRFDEEAKAIASLKHPNIISLYEWGTYEEMHYFSMDFIDGEDLEKRSKELLLRDSIKIIIKIAHALHYAHLNKIIHRDVKPHNILLDQRNNPYLTDFGLAKNFESDISVTKTGVVFGTPAYMAPEQARGHMSSIDGRADIYSLGVTLYEILTGKKPFSGDSGIQVLIKAIEENVKPIRDINPNLPQELEVICQKAMAKNKEERYPTAEAMAHDLEAYLNFQPIEAKVKPRLFNRIKKNPFFTILCLITAQLLLFLTLYFFWWKYFSSDGFWTFFERQNNKEYFQTYGEGMTHFDKENSLFSLQPALNGSIICYRELKGSPIQNVGFKFDLHFLANTPLEKRYFRFFFNTSSKKETFFTTGYQILIKGQLLEISNPAGDIKWGGNWTEISSQKDYQIRIEKIHDKFRHQLQVVFDGHLLLKVEDYFPNHTTKTFGFEANSNISIENFEVFKYNNPNQYVSDYLFLKGSSYKEAYEEYGKLITSYFEEEFEQIYFQQQLCLYKLSKQKEGYKPKGKKLPPSLGELHLALLTDKSKSWLLSQIDYFWIYLLLYKENNLPKATEILEFQLAQEGKKGHFYWLFLKYLTEQEANLAFFQKQEIYNILEVLLKREGFEKRLYNHKISQQLHQFVLQLERKASTHYKSLEKLYFLLGMYSNDDKLALSYEIKYCQIGRWQLSKYFFPPQLYREVLQRYEALLTKKNLLSVAQYEMVLKECVSLYRRDEAKEEKAREICQMLKRQYQNSNSAPNRLKSAAILLIEISMLLEKQRGFQTVVEQEKTKRLIKQQVHAFLQAYARTPQSLIENPYILLLRYLGGLLSLKQLDSVFESQQEKQNPLFAQKDSLYLYTLALYYYKLDLCSKEEARGLYQKAYKALMQEELWPYLPNPFPKD